MVLDLWTVYLVAYHQLLPVRLCGLSHNPVLDRWRCYGHPGVCQCAIA